MDIFSWVFVTAPVWRDAALFLLVMLAGVGVPMPANTLLLLAGAFAGDSYQHLFFLFLLGLIANVLGDAICYWLAYHFGGPLLRRARESKRYFVQRIVQALDPAERFLSRHQRLAIIATRVVSPANTAVNLLAGLAQLPFVRFLMYDVIGNALSIGGALLLGFFIDEYWQKAAAATSISGVTVSVLIISGVILFLLWRPRKEKSNR